MRVLGFIYSLVFNLNLISTAILILIIMLKNCKIECDNLVVEREINVEDLKIHYKETSGTSTLPLVLLHGYSFSSQTWHTLGTLDLLEKNKIHAYAIDMPGFGKSTGKRISLSQPDTLVKFMSTLFEALNIDDLMLLGPSMGGGYAIIYTISNPSKVKGLVLVAPAGLDKPFISQHLDKLTMPVLIFWGDKDYVFKIDLGYTLEKELPNAKLVVCKGAKHPCYLDVPELFHQELIRFIKQILS